ncbi:unnamed protein product [Prunus brigantina]
MFPKFCTQSDIDWSMKSDNSGSYAVRYEMEWFLYSVLLRLDFTQSQRHDSSHHIMMFPKFCTQSDIDWSMKSDNSGSYAVRSELEWFLYSVLLRLDFTQSQRHDSSHHIMMFPKFCTQSDIDWSMKSDNSGSYAVRSEMEWFLYSVLLRLDFTQSQRHDSSHHIMMFPKFCTQSDIDWSMKSDNSGSYAFIDLSMKSDNSGSYAVRSEMEWLVHSIVVEIGFHSKPTK